MVAGASTTPGCLTDQYVEHSQSQVVMTSWALLALMDLPGANSGAVQRGIEWLRSMQRDDGSWPSIGQRCFLWLRDARLPVIQNLLPGMGPRPLCRANKTAVNSLSKRFAITCFDCRAFSNKFLQCCVNLRNSRQSRPVGSW